MYIAIIGLIYFFSIKIARLEIDCEQIWRENNLAIITNGKLGPKLYLSVRDY
jgi:hypothetical protein